MTITVSAACALGTSYAFLSGDKKGRITMPDPVTDGQTIVQTTKVACGIELVSK